MAAGLVVFPVLPVAWHVWSERAARKKALEDKKAKPKKTTGIERFVFRTIVVAVVALGGLVVIARGRVWTAVKNDALWFIPTSVGSLAPDSKLLDQVPPSAQFVAWLRPTDDAQATLGKLARGKDLGESVVAATQAGKSLDVAVIERGELFIPLIQNMETLISGFTAKNGIDLPWASTVTKDVGDAKTWSTPGWAKEIGTGRAPVLELVKRAPDDAFVVAVAKVPPATKPAPIAGTPMNPLAPDALKRAAEEAAAKGITLVAWMRAPHERVEIDITLEAADEQAATVLMAALDKSIAELNDREAKGMACWRKNADEAYVRREGQKLHAHYEIDEGGLQGVLACANITM